MKRLVLLLSAFSVVLLAQPSNLWATLPTGLVYITKTATGGLVFEGVDVPGTGIKLEKSAATGKLQLVGDPAFGTRVAWAEEVQKNSQGQWQTINLPAPGYVIIWYVPASGPWTFLVSGFKFTGKVVTFDTPPPDGARVFASYLF
jgi:hypothetical protein